MLEKAGRKTELVNGKRRPRYRILADLLWEAVFNKTVTLPDGTKLVLSPDDWWANVQFIYKQIDGPPKQSVEVSPDGVLKVLIEYVGDSDTTAEAAQEPTSD